MRSSILALVGSLVAATGTVARTAAVAPAGSATHGSATPPRFDYVVVGAGAAGSVLAARLSEDPAVTVLVLEAGGPDGDPRIQRPASFRELVGSAYDWSFSTEPEPQLRGRRISWPSGKVWGGSGSLSAMVYVRGHPTDFDAWQALGHPGWGYDDVLPFFKKAENQERGASRYHGVGGPQSVADPRWVPPISLAFRDAALEIGLPPNDDFNGVRQQGVGLYQLNQKDGERHSAAAAYLRPALARPNLSVFSHARVTRILFEDRRAVGVAYLRDGETREVRAAREVILSAGTIGSPQLLLLSGVGPAAELEALGIQVRQPLPGVGRNLQDHPRVALSFRSKQRLGFASEAEREQAIRDYERDRSGPLASNGVGAGAFVKASAEDPAPAFQIFLTANAPRDTYSLNVALMHPASRGYLGLRSTDPAEPPLLQAGYLSDARDLEALVRGLEVARRIAGADALVPYRGEELAPGAERWSPEALRGYVRETATTFYHPVGTCRMGDDPLAVVDHQLRVRGLEGLRVVDASVMPTLVSGATHAATVMIAERAAELIQASR